MKLLFIEPDTVFFRWLTTALDGHECVQVRDVKEAKADGFDAAFLDVGAFSDPSEAALARMICKGIPLIALTGNIARADLLQICDGMLSKGMIETDPGRLIPVAAAALQKKKAKAHGMDETGQLYNAIKAMRLKVA